MGTRIVLMREGVVQQVGTPRDIYTNPANTFVARFIGTPAMNLVHAQLDAAQGQLQVGGQALAIPAHLVNLLPGAPAGGRRAVLLGIRPNALTIRATAPSDAATAAPATGLTGTVSLVEHVGSESIITVRLDQARTAHDRDGGAADEIMVTETGYSSLAAGVLVRIQPDLSAAVVFAADSGERLSRDQPVAPGQPH